MRRLLCGVIPLSILAAAWAGFWWSGYGVLIARVTTTVETQSTVECHYLHATGRRDVVSFTTDPRTVRCAGLMQVRTAAPDRAETRWAAPLPADRRVELECRFFEHSGSADSGLGALFSPAVPLRLVIDLARQQVAFVRADDQVALGAPVKTEVAPFGIMLRFEHGTLPVFTGAHRGRLTIVITAREGRAGMFLLSRASMHLMWSRVGGCRPRAAADGSA